MQLTIKLNKVTSNATSAIETLVRLLFLTFGLKIFIRKNTYITNQISKIILSKQIFNLKSESDLRFCISLDSDSSNNRISIKSEPSQHFKIKYQSPFIRTRFLFFGYVLGTFLTNNEILGFLGFCELNSIGFLSKSKQILNEISIPKNGKSDQRLIYLEDF